MVINGKIISGFGEASKNLPYQLPELVKFFAEIKECHHGSINIQIEKPLKIINPDFESEPIKWHPYCRDLQEKFGITRIKFAYLNNENKNKSITAWVYDPYCSPHRDNPFYLEIIAPFIEIDRSKPCLITIERTCREEPFIILD